MKQRFTHAAKENRLHGFGHGLQHMTEILQGKVADGLVKPGVPETHFAVQVAFGGGFDVQFS